MFRNRSFGLAVVLVLLAMVTLILGTAVATPAAALSAKGSSDPGYAANLIDWFLQHGGSGYRDDASNNPGYAANLIDWFLQHGGSGYRDDASNDTASAIPVRPKGFGELKDKQLERSDAAQFAGANITAADEEDSYYTMRPSASGWWEYHYYDALKNKWYAYHYVTTPTGPVIDASYEFQGKPEGAASGCGLSRTEPDC